jgi:hypothetical protein
MAFSEKTKHIAKLKAAFRCCICQQLFVEVHHIVPEAEGGRDTLDNAAPLCASCHDLYGGNPEKRKTIREMRDHWWRVMEKREANLTRSPAMEEYIGILENPRPEDALHSKPVAIYHRVFENEDFTVAATQIYELVRRTQVRYPNARRVLFLDIDGHRNEKGGWDHDMWELQRHFLLPFMMPFLSELHIPLLTVGNNRCQRNDLVERLDIMDGINVRTLNEAIDRGVSDIWLADRDKWIKLDET